MNHFSSAHLTNRTLARSLRLSLFAVLTLLCGLLLPLFAPAAHAQSAPQNTLVAWGGSQSAEIPAELANTSIIAIGAGQDANIVATHDGQVISWGNGCENRTIPGVVAVDIGFYNCLALTGDGTVVAWGTSVGASVPAGLSHVTAIAAGKESDLALTRDGTVVGWGNNDYGQLTMPADLHDVTAIAAGWWSGMALKRDGTVVAWGHGAFVPDGLNNVTAIAAGGDHYLALKSDGTVVAWGYNADGQASVPEGLSNVVAISAGLFHSMALKSDGTVVAWGDSAEATVPAGLSHVTAIAAGFAHSLVLETFDTTPPTVTASVSQTTASASATVTITASDATSGAASTSYTINDGAPQVYTAPFVLNAVGTYHITYTSTDTAGNRAAAQSLTVTVAAPTIVHGPSIDVIATPPSVLENTLESDTLIRLFPERQNYTLPAALTVDAQGAPGTVIPTGTEVNVYYIHADKVGNNNSTVLKLSGSVTFDTQILGVVTNGSSLLATHSTLGSLNTTYSTSVDQGIDYGDKVTVYPKQNRVDVAFDLWSMSDDVRVITLAP